MKKKLLRHIKMMSIYSFVGLLIQVVFLNLLLADDLSAQKPKSIEDVYINIHLEDAKLIKAFKTIESKTNYRFAFDRKDLDNKVRLDLDIKNGTIKDVLLNISKVADLKFKQVNYDIDVSKLNKKIIGDPSEVIKVILQDKTITGQVISGEDDIGLPGVNVLIKGTSRGTVTDLDGNYTIDVPSNEATLVFSSVGFVSEEVNVTNQSVVNITLMPDVTALEEIVVIGYGEQQKKNLTGAVAKVEKEDIENLNVVNFGEAIQGIVPGVSVKSSGRPGSEPKIEIRGLGNFTDNDPLYIIDGLPTTANRDFNINDIESIQILKDASAAAIYGSRAANGVVIITTKKGKEGPMKVEFSSKVGIENTPRYDLMDREEWIRFNNMAYDEAIESGVPGVTARQNHMEGNTDWQDETFETAIMYDQNLTFSGGGENGNYLVSLNTVGNTGTSVGTDYQRYGARVNTTGKKGIFTIGENLAISNFLVNELETNPFWDVIRMLPTIPVYDEDNPGGYGYGDEARARTFGVNPIARENLENRQTENLRIRGNLFGNVNITDYLKYELNFGLEVSNDAHKYLRKVGNWTLNQPFDPSRRYEEKTQFMSRLLENTLTFNKDIGKHFVNAVIGTSYQKIEQERIWGEGSNLAEVSGQYYTVLDAATTDFRTGGFLNEAAILSYFGRVNYDFDDRYLLMLTLRRDGSSRVAEDKRWGNFPSASIGWRLSNENFFDVNWINDLKLRASYGRLGTSNIGYYDYQGILNLNPQAVYGTDQHVENGVTQVALVNTDLKWEELEQTNFGFDATVLNSRLTIAADYFISTTEDVLTRLPILMTTGHDGDAPFVNAASLRNKGIELAIDWNETKGDFNYAIGVNFSRLRNEVLDLGYGQVEYYTWMTKTEIGEPIGEYYLIKSDGLFQSEQEVEAHTNSEGTMIQPNALPGDIRYVDANDDGQITSEDRQIVGSPWPDFEYGVNVKLGYKNFDFSLFGFGAQGYDIFNGPRSVMDRFDDNSGYRAGISPWTPENTDTDFPRIVYGDQRNSRGDQDRWLEDGSFFSIRQMTLGYTIPGSILGGIFSDSRIAVTGQNLVTLTGYTGLDPEFTPPNNDIFRKTHDEAQYPSPRIVTFNLQLKF